jgi:hypothetical protein
LIFLKSISLIEFLLALLGDLSLVVVGVLLSVVDMGWLTADVLLLEETLLAVLAAADRSLATDSLLLVMPLSEVLPPADKVESSDMSVGGALLLLVVGLMSSNAAGDPSSACPLEVPLSFGKIGRIIWPGRGISLCRFDNFFLPLITSSAWMASSAVQFCVAITSSMARITL